jgi:hypothetical protein
MKKLIIMTFGLFLVLSFQSNSLAQITYDLQFVQVTNDGTNGGNFDVKVQIKSNNGTFGMDTGNLVFTYNTAGLSFDALWTTHNFSGVFYQPMTVTEPFLGSVSINIELGISPATTVQQTFMDVATIEFTIEDNSETSMLAWRTQSPSATLVISDIPEIIQAGNLNNADVSLPVTLALFETVVEKSKVKVQWTTESEINNLGFEVYRALEKEADYVLLSGYETNPDLTGQGNSSVRHEYSYTDKSAEPETTYWYKLADLDYMGVKTFHDPVSVTTPEAIPTDFKLHHNYPNPFNPTTTVRFDIPITNAEFVDTKLIIYNTLGQVTKTLYQEKLSAGSYEVQWDGTTDSGNNAPSGVYFLLFRANDFSQTEKLLLVK